MDSKVLIGFKLFVALHQHVGSQATADAKLIRPWLLTTRWRLTPRQAEVLALLARGLPNKTIATLLRTAERTIEHHVAALLEKAEVESRAALVAKFWTAR